MMIKENVNECRKNEFEYLKLIKHRQYVIEQIKLYEMYYDVLNKKEKKELKHLKTVKKNYSIIGKAIKSK